MIEKLERLLKAYFKERALPQGFGKPRCSVRYEMGHEYTLTVYSPGFEQYYKATAYVPEQWESSGLKKALDELTAMMWAPEVQYLRGYY